MRTCSHCGEALEPESGLCASDACAQAAVTDEAEVEQIEQALAEAQRREGRLIEEKDLDAAYVRRMAEYAKAAPAVRALLTRLGWSERPMEGWAGVTVHHRADCPLLELWVGTSPAAGFEVLYDGTTVYQLRRKVTPKRVERYLQRRNPERERATARRIEKEFDEC